MGKWLVTQFFSKYNHHQVDPLSPDNYLIITTGPVTGSTICGSCCLVIFTKCL